MPARVPEDPLALLPPDNETPEEMAQRHRAELEAKRISVRDGWLMLARIC